MPLKTYKPTSPGRRLASVSTFEEITRKGPEPGLVTALKKWAGRNSAGRIAVRHRGGGAKRKYRAVDFKRDKAGVPASVAAIEYDPNRSARIALLHYADGEKRYIIAPAGLAVGMKVMSGQDAEPTLGNALPMGKMPVGIEIHNIELKPAGGGKLVRSAGLSAVLTAKDEKNATLRMPSGETRMINAKCSATVGKVGNPDHENISLGKAGRKRWNGIRPTVRGVAMNPIDHPMGGGEGKASGGHPQSPWGTYAKGQKTRRKRKSNKFIIARR